MSGLSDQVIPPQEYVDRVNAGRPGLPPLTRLDPLAMALWHIATEDHSLPSPLITGI